MNEVHYHSAECIGAKEVKLTFRRGTTMPTTTIPVEEAKELTADCANIIREIHLLSTSEHIIEAILEGLDTETRVARSVNAVQVARPPDAIQPTILHLEFGTETGPMILRITQIAAQELVAALNKHELTRGCV